MGINHNACGYELKCESCGSECVEEFVETEPLSREVWLLNSVDQSAERITESAECNK